LLLLSSAAARFLDHPQPCTAFLLGCAAITAPEDLELPLKVARMCCSSSSSSSSSSTGSIFMTAPQKSQYVAAVLLPALRTAALEVKLAMLQELVALSEPPYLEAWVAALLGKRTSSSSRTSSAFQREVAGGMAAQEAEHAAVLAPVLQQVAATAADVVLAADCTVADGAACSDAALEILISLAHNAPLLAAASSSPVVAAAAAGAATAGAAAAAGLPVEVQGGLDLVLPELQRAVCGLVKAAVSGFAALSSLSPPQATPQAGGASTEAREGSSGRALQQQQADLQAQGCTATLALERLQQLVTSLNPGKSPAASARFVKQPGPACGDKDACWAEEDDSSAAALAAAALREEVYEAAAAAAAAAGSAGAAPGSSSSAAAAADSSGIGQSVFMAVKVWHCLLQATAGAAGRAIRQACEAACEAACQQLGPADHTAGVTQQQQQQQVPASVWVVQWILGCWCSLLQLTTVDWLNSSSVSQLLPPAVHPADSATASGTSRVLRMGMPGVVNVAISAQQFALFWKTALRQPDLIRSCW
jgi:hypothetical protein